MSDNISKQRRLLLGAIGICLVRHVSDPNESLVETSALHRSERSE